MARQGPIGIVSPERQTRTWKLNLSPMERLESPRKMLTTSARGMIDQHFVHTYFVRLYSFDVKA